MGCMGRQPQRVFDAGKEAHEQVHQRESEHEL